MAQVRRLTKRSVLSAAVLAAAFAMAGCTSAAASGGTPAAISTSPATQAGGVVHFIDYSVNSDGPDSRVLLTGAVGDYGPAVTVFPDGNVDPGHTSEMKLELIHGAFRINIAGIHKKVVIAFSHFPGDPRTCSGSISFTAAAPIVAGSGTGSYRGISGSFNLTGTIGEVDVKPVCDGSGKFLSQVILLVGSGTVSF